MNIKSLQHFLSLADNLHFGRASNANHISVSALSRTIRQLENELGVTLFNRDNRSVALTNEGHRFYEYARDAVSQWELIQNELGESCTDLHGKLSIYCSVTASYSILFDLLNQFRPNYPGIEIKLHTGDPESAITRIIAGSEDISIAAHPNHLPRGVVFKAITTSPLVFIAPITQIDIEVPVSSPITPDDWKRVPMVLSETGLARNRVDKWFRDIGINPLIYAQVEGYEAIVSIVSLGFGVGVVPKIVLDNSPLASRIRILEIKPALEAFEVGLFTMKRSLNNPLVKAFWELI